MNVHDNRICSITDCGKPIKARGICSMHYEKWRKYGDPLKTLIVQHDGICTIDGCAKPYLAKGWCVDHYYRWRRHGDPLAGGTKRGLPNEYLRDVVLKYSGTDCLIWPFAKSGSGYALIHSNRSRVVPRLICAAIHGEPPSENHVTRHLCGNGDLGCVNPMHLVWGTPSENQYDRVDHGTDIRGEKHPFSILREDQVKIIRELRGVKTQDKIAMDFGVSRTTISGVQNGHTWSWLE